MKKNISTILVILLFISGCKSESTSSGTESGNTSNDDLILSDSEVNDPTQYDPIATTAINEIELKEIQIAWVKENLPGAVILDDPMMTMVDGEAITLSDRVITADFGLLKCILIRLPNGNKRVLYFDVNFP